MNVAISMEVLACLISRTRDSNAMTPVCWNSVRLPLDMTPNGEDVTVHEEALGGAMLIRLLRRVSLEIFRPPKIR